MRRALRWTGLGLLIVLIVGLIAPFIAIGSWKEQIRAGLERSLQRKVEIHGDAYLSVFRGPGFSLEKVVIHDDPSIGVEPLASVPELQATVSFRSLWTGRLEFASVRFVEPSLNLARAGGGAWNFVPLVQAAAVSDRVRIPEIIVEAGRINFRIDDVKSTFYLTATDLTLVPEKAGIGIRFSCAPARTDRSATGYGLFSGSGRLIEGKIDLDVELEESPIEELLTFARGSTLGLHGIIASRARITGPVLNPEVRGRFEMKDVHRWDLVDNRTGGWAMNYRGRIDLAGQQFELAAGAQDNEKLPVSLRVFVSRLLTSPDWRAEAGVEALPASALLEFARHMGTPLPAGLAVEGQVDGTIAYSNGSGMHGEVRIGDASVQIEAGPTFTMPQASLVFSGDEVQLRPAVLAGKGNAAQLEATYAPFRQHLKAQLTGRGLRIADLQSGAGHLLNGVDVPVMNRFRGGTWSGVVRYSASNSNRGSWSASLLVRNTSTTIPGIAGPLEVETANIDLDETNLRVRRIKATAGKLDILGEYSWKEALERPHQFDLTIPSADLAEIERVLAPTLQRSSGFLARALRLRSAAPAWLATRQAEGRIRIGTLTAGDLEFRGLRTRVVWRGTEVQFQDLRARYEKAPITGSLDASLSGAQPRYALSGKLTGFPWKQGRVDLAGDLKTAGMGADLLLNLRAEGRFEARSVSMGPEMAFGNASGSFEVAGTRSGPSIRLASVQAAIGAERFNGEGGTTTDGRVLLDLESQSRSLRLHGPVAALKMEVTGERTAVR